MKKELFVEILDGTLLPLNFVKDVYPSGHKSMTLSTRLGTQSSG